MNPTTTRMPERRPNDGGPVNDERPTLRDVKQDVAQLKHDVAQCAGGAARTGIDAVKIGASHLAQTGRKVGHAARETHERMCGYVSAHPTTSLLVAAGLGALLARVLPRR
jgi:ElaB/YqjD/DUF883 family membrane-anchored ribosome-binding protein